MSLSSRIHDLYPVLLVFALVAAFATFLVATSVVANPVQPLPPQGLATDEAPAAAPTGPVQKRTKPTR